MAQFWFGNWHLLPEWNGYLLKDMVSASLHGLHHLPSTYDNPAESSIWSIWTTHWEEGPSGNSGNFSPAFQYKTHNPSANHYLNIFTSSSEISWWFTAAAVAAWCYSSISKSQARFIVNYCHCCYPCWLYILHFSIFLAMDPVLPKKASQVDQEAKVKFFSWKLPCPLQSKAPLLDWLIAICKGHYLSHFSIQFSGRPKNYTNINKLHCEPSAILHSHIWY